MPESPHSPMTTTKRRRIRKGTQSCWECKRRKIRCSFASPTEPICDGCRSRRTKCVSQAFDEEPPRRPLMKSRRWKVGGNRVHRVVETSSAVEGEEEEEEEEQQTATSGQPNPEHDDVVLSKSLLVSGGELHEISSALLAVWPSDSDLEVLLSTTTTTTTPAALSNLFHGVVCLPYADFLSRQIASSPRSMLQRPPKATHPVLIARRLLMLGTLLQGIQPSTSSSSSSSSSSTGPTSQNYRTRLMAHAVTTASRLVTTSDELAGGSLEGIECVMAESMFLNNAGELRRAWLAGRRAMALAQAMGLHRCTRHDRGGDGGGGGGGGGGRPSSLVVLEPDTWDRIDPEYMWCRLIFSDRYLSLMLGLPPGCSDGDGDDEEEEEEVGDNDRDNNASSSFASPEALVRCAPLERMERMMAVAGGLILRRNNSVLRRRGADMATTRKIDEMLREAAALMSPRWWLAAPESSRPITTATSDRTEEEVAFQDSLRVVNQFTHRHLLLQLHLPYLLLPPSHSSSSSSSAAATAAAAMGAGAGEKSCIDYSKITAATTSRELVSQFVSFRSNSTSAPPAYCRGIDFIAFIASTTLCLAHIEAHRPRPQGTAPSTLQSLQHQRQSDRGLLERTLEIMETAARETKDAIAQRILRILRPLLDVEYNAAKGLCIYETTTSAPEDGRLHEAQPAGADDAHDDNDDDDDAPFNRALRIQIPHLGTVRIAHRPAGGAAVLCEQAGPSSPLARDRVFSRNDIHHVDNPDWQPVPSPSWLHPTTVGASAWEPGPVSLDAATNHAQEDPGLLVPGLAADVVDDYWALQGVDMALFSNLTQGCSMGDSTGTEFTG